MADIAPVFKYYQPQINFNIMESIFINSITNNLSTESVTIDLPGGGTMTLAPNNSFEFEDFTLPVISTAEEVSSSTIMAFTVEGFSQDFGYAAVSGVGLVSALGHSGTDFFPSDEHLIHITVSNFQADDAVNCNFEINDLADGTRVTWVLGELDEA